MRYIRHALIHLSCAAVLSRNENECSAAAAAGKDTSASQQHQSDDDDYETAESTLFSDQSSSMEASMSSCDDVSCSAGAVTTHKAAVCTEQQHVANDETSDDQVVTECVDNAVDSNNSLDDVETTLSDSLLSSDVTAETTLASETLCTPSPADLQQQQQLQQHAHTDNSGQDCDSLDQSTSSSPLLDRKDTVTSFDSGIESTGGGESNMKHHKDLLKIAKEAANLAEKQARKSPVRAAAPGTAHKTLAADVQECSVAPVHRPTAVTRRSNTPANSVATHSHSSPQINTAGSVSDNTRSKARKHCVSERAVNAPVADDLVVSDGQAQARNSPPTLSHVQSAQSCPDMEQAQNQQRPEAVEQNSKVTSSTSRQTADVERPMSQRAKPTAQIVSGSKYLLRYMY